MSSFGEERADRDEPNIAIVIKQEGEERDEADAISDEEFQEEETEESSTAVVKREPSSIKSVDAIEWDGQTCHKTKPTHHISFLEVLKILEHYEGKVCIAHPHLPLAGEAYLFDQDVNGDSWEEDGYQWITLSAIPLPKNDPKVMKRTDFLVFDGCDSGSKHFQRISYSSMASPNIILVHYVGDHTVSKQKLHKRRPDTRPRRRMKTVKLEPIEDSTSDDDQGPMKPLDLNEVVEMLESYKDKISSTGAHKPLGGEIYYYDCTKLGDSWKNDGYLWRNSGKRHVPIKDPKFEKTYYTVRMNSWTRDGNSAFQRVVYKLLTRPHIALVHYIGDSSVYKGDNLLQEDGGGDVTPRLRKKRRTNMYPFTQEEVQNPPPPILITPSKVPLSPEDALKTLEENEGKECARPPYRPKAGEAFMFKVQGRIRDVWKHDGYDWYYNSPEYYPRNKPLVSKKLCLIRTESAPRGDKCFQKIIFNLLSNTKLVLVHYFGDESLIHKGGGEKRKADEEIVGNITSKQRVDEEMVSGFGDGANIEELAMEQVDEEEEGVKHRALKLQEAVDILTNFEGNISQSRAVRPKAGEIYLFDSNLIGDDWRCDNYVWRNSGTIYQPKKNPIIKKVYHSIRLDEKKREGSKVFQKTAYSLMQRPNIVMVHYTGDETVFKPIPHGNRKRNFVEYTRTAPSVLASIKQAITQTPESTPKNTLKHLSMTQTLEELPRDLYQIRNTKRLMTQKKQIDYSPLRGASKVKPQTGPTSTVSVNLSTLSEIARPSPPSSPEQPEQFDAPEPINDFSEESEPLRAAEASLPEGTVVENTPSFVTSASVAGIIQPPMEAALPEQPLPTDIVPDPTVIMSPPPGSSMAGPSDNPVTSPLRTALIAKMEKDQPIVLQALDPRPEVCKVQMDILNQQKRNLELQEAKLMLEIKKLQQAEEKQAPLGEEVKMDTSQVSSEQNQNIIYIQDPDAIGGAMNVADGAQLEQVIYIEDAAAFAADSGGQIQYVNQQYT